MSILTHTIESPDGFTPAKQDRVIVGSLPGITNAAGGSAGAAVATAVTLPASASLPANYSVLVNPGQDATWYVSNKTSTGFTVTLTPRLAASTLAAGAFDVVVVA
ncbi:TPA: hypothetical protein VDB83_001174 [Burkholderia cenocepacia]|uniref:hypothetical protein n=1 Tax=Burkholderia cenocepacia TaxID=95486 RepID=UPI001B96E669|nr:hypothetical protein [Burkholderia cenocepacia]MBR8096334.1 hypothetical protein [Burkholderia cenocepacia]HEP6426903.1 hypothetical protein [Burkholderia cenocepacia]